MIQISRTLNKVPIVMISPVHTQKPLDTKPSTNTVSPICHVPISIALF